jgi:hypothetical protein
VCSLFFFEKLFLIEAAFYKLNKHSLYTALSREVFFYFLTPARNAHVTCGVLIVFAYALPLLVAAAFAYAITEPAQLSTPAVTSHTNTQTFFPATFVARIGACTCTVLIRHECAVKSNKVVALTFKRIFHLCPNNSPLHASMIMALRPSILRLFLRASSLLR